MDWSHLDPPPVGVRLLASDQEAASVPAYEGVSYCDAVRRAGEGECLRILPDSLEVCGWSQVVLGLKEPGDPFEEGLEPRLDFPVSGLLLAPVDGFPGTPDVVLVRAKAELLGEMARAAGQDPWWTGHGGRLDRSAIPALTRGPWHQQQGAEELPRFVGVRLWFLGGVNQILGGLARSERWQAFTRWLFQSRWVTARFDALISRTLADMSICRNSTVIPLLTGQANLSFFCTGGITWGRNRPEYLTSGWPWPIFQRVDQVLSRQQEGDR
ncbi:MAG: hypothetical protein ACK2U9_12615 [Anaerolineae bacterium]|jgi:uncharacterized protein (DUF169 family)